MIGAGIVGLATAHALVTQHPGTSVVVVDKEGSIAGHQTGRNSGVIHAGVYYKPGSAKAGCAATGRERMVEFCDDHEVAHDVCGKLIVAGRTDELPRLAELHRRCVANGVDVEPDRPGRLRELEPHADGLQALHVPVTGIVDYRRVCRALAERIVEPAASCACDDRVGVAEESAALVVADGAGPIRAGAARQLRRAPRRPDRPPARRRRPVRGMTIVPFRGEYYELVPARCAPRPHR